MASWWWDYVVIVAWLLALTVLVGAPQLIGWWDLSRVWTNPWSADLALTLLTVFPYLLYLVIFEVKSPHATLGKQKSRLRVIDRPGGFPGKGQVVVRNLVKVLPWQLGHMGAMRLATSPEVAPVGLWLEVASLALLAMVVVPILLGRRGVHDVLAGTAVVSTETGRQF